mgnify:CR=1 FL=1
MNYRMNLPAPVESDATMESAWTYTISDESLSAELAELYERARGPVTGTLGNILRVHSLYPAGLRAYLDLYTGAMRGDTGPALR